MLEISVISSSIVSASKVSGTKRSAFIEVREKKKKKEAIFPLLEFFVPGLGFVVCSHARYKSYPLSELFGHLGVCSSSRSGHTQVLLEGNVLFDMPACSNSIFMRACVCL